MRPCDDVADPALPLPRHIEEGVVDSVVIWETRDLGYLVALSAHAVACGGLEPAAVSLRAGRGTRSASALPHREPRNIADFH